MPFLQSNDRNILFIHIPKTGGTSICEWLKQHGEVRFYSDGVPPALRTTPQHLRHTDVRHLFGDEFFQYTFTVVRDPYSRIESEYQFRRDLSGRLRRPPLPEFSLWLELQLKRAGEFEWHLDNHLRPQVDFLGSGVEVFRFEDGIGRAIRSVSAATGLPVPASIPHARARSAGAEKLHWDLHDRLLVNRFYAEDFERLEYEMVK